MPRLFSLYVLLACLALVLPASAGTITATDGRGSWQSTRCTPPAPPLVVAPGPEIPADNLNALLARHNAFAASAQAYMACISREAQGDAESAGQLVTRTAQGIIQQMQAQVGASAARLQRRP